MTPKTYVIKHLGTATNLASQGYLAIPSAPVHFCSLTTDDDRTLSRLVMTFRGRREAVDGQRRRFLGHIFAVRRVRTRKDGYLYTT